MLALYYRLVGLREGLPSLALVVVVKVKGLFPAESLLRAPQGQKDTHPRTSSPGGGGLLAPRPRVALASTPQPREHLVYYELLSQVRSSSATI